MAKSRKLPITVGFISLGCPKNVIDSERMLAQIAQNDLLITPQTDNVDVIVTGHYIDNAQNPLITIRPLTIVKSNKKIVTKNLQFKKDDLTTKDPVSGKTILKKGAYDEIAQAVKELLEQL